MKSFTNMAARDAESSHSSSEFSDEEADLFDEDLHETKVQGYRFEPLKSRSSSESDSLTESDSESEIQPARLTLPVSEWCSCEHCSRALLANEKEARCCQEIVGKKMENESGM